MKTQAISLLTLSVLLAQDTLKGAWVTATGETPSGQAPLLGVTDTDGKQGQMVCNRHWHSQYEFKRHCHKPC